MSEKDAKHQRNTEVDTHMLFSPSGSILSTHFVLFASPLSVEKTYKKAANQVGSQLANWRKCQAKDVFWCPTVPFIEVRLKYVNLKRATALNRAASTFIEGFVFAVLRTFAGTCAAKISTSLISMISQAAEVPLSPFAFTTETFHLLSGPPMCSRRQHRWPVLL